MAELVEPVELPETIIRDRKDIPILGCAVGGKANYLVTGDDDFLSLHSYQEITFVSPVEFLEILNTP